MLKKIGAASAITAAMLLSTSPAYAQVTEVAPIDIDNSNVNFCHNTIIASGAALTIPDILGTPSEETQVGDCAVWEDVIIIVNENDDDHHGDHQTNVRKWHHDHCVYHHDEANETNDQPSLLLLLLRRRGLQVWL